MDGERDLDSQQRARRAAAIGIALAYALSVAVFAVNLLNNDLPVLYRIAGAVSLGAVMAVSPTLAPIALRGRTALFLPAALIAVVQSPILYFLGLILIVGAFIWIWAFLRFGNPLGLARTVSAFLVVCVVWVAAAATLFIHIDPICVEWLADGTVRSVDASDLGFTSGWAWNQPNTVTGEWHGSVDVVRSACSSDILTPIEAAVALALSIAAVGTGAAIFTPLSADSSEGSP